MNIGLYSYDREELSKISNLLENHTQYNLISSKVKIPVYELQVSYFTFRDNLKKKQLYYVGFCPYEEEFEDFYFNDDVKSMVQNRVGQGKYNVDIDYFVPLGNIVVDVSAAGVAGKRFFAGIDEDDCNGMLIADLKKAHPMSIIMGDMRLSLEEVRVKYETARKNERITVKYVIHRNATNEEIREKLHVWTSEFNSKYPYRPFLNVQFLGNSCIGTVRVA